MSLITGYWVGPHILKSPLMVAQAKSEFPSCVSIKPRFLQPTQFSSVCSSLVQSVPVTVGTLMCMLLLAWVATVSLHTGAAAKDSVLVSRWYLRWSGWVTMSDDMLAAASSYVSAARHVCLAFPPRKCLHGGFWITKYPLSCLVLQAFRLLNNSWSLDLQTKQAGDL